MADEPGDVGDGPGAHCDKGLVSSVEGKKHLQDGMGVCHHLITGEDHRSRVEPGSPKRFPNGTAQDSVGVGVRNDKKAAESCLPAERAQVRYRIRADRDTRPVHGSRMTFIRPGSCR